MCLLRTPADIVEFKELRSRYVQIDVTFADQGAARRFIIHCYAVFPQAGAGSIGNSVWISARLGCADADDAVEQPKRIVRAVADRCGPGEMPVIGEVNRNKDAGPLSAFKARRRP